jgi:hypothetical protein
MYLEAKKKQVIRVFQDCGNKNKILQFKCFSFVSKNLMFLPIPIFASLNGNDRFIGNEKFIFFWGLLEKKSHQNLGSQSTPAPARLS